MNKRELGQRLFWVLIGVVVAVIFTTSFPQIKWVESLSACDKKYPFTSQSLGCSEYKESADRMDALDAKLNTAVEKFEKSGKVTRISVWVRDLETRQWAAANEFQTYTPASLMKLPLLITYLKLIEHQPYLLEEKVVYKKSPELNSDNQNFKPASPLVVGETYSVQELLEHAVINSDNDAAAMLAAHLGDASYRNTLIELGVYIPLGNDTVDFITAKTYANIFRILYNASYLSRESSEFALGLMSKSQFKGIAEPLPPSTVVSHKFGELELTRNNNVYLRQLHDCGVVYKEGRPYTLCIMTQGKNFDDLYSALKDFSKMVYEAM